MIFEQYRDDLKNRYAGSDFNEIPTGDCTIVEFFDAGGVIRSSGPKLDKSDAYREIREDLIGLRSEVMITVTEVQRDAWTGTPHTGEGPIYNTDGGREHYDGTDWIP